MSQRKLFELDDYQWDAVNKLRTGSILCGGYGSGKSRTALAYFFVKECGGSPFPYKDADHILKKPKDLYIITTAKKRDSLEWEGECSYFRLSRDPKLSVSGVKVVVDSWNNITKYISTTGAFFIFDEQRVVGKGTWVNSFLKIAKRNNWILLSATPGDCWSDYIPVFIANGFYKNRTEFINRHVVYSRATRYPQIDRYLDDNHLTKLRDSILVDMPFKRDTVQHHEDVMCSYNRASYDDVMRNRFDIFKNEPIADAASLCYVLRRIVNSDPSRLIKLIDIFEEHPKLIIFYNFDYELQILKQLPFPTYEWNGHKHEPIPKNKDRWLYLVQYTAGCEGWNCIETDTIIFFSQSYSYKVVTQATGRIDRRNTPYKDLYYYHFKSTSSIDRAISRSLKKKKIFNERSFAIF